MQLSSVFAMLSLVAAGSAASERPSLGRRDSDRYLRRYAQSPSAAGSVLPTLTGEFLIDTVLRYVPAPYYQQYAATAFDGTNFLVVWADQRAGSYDICGARVSPQGAVLDVPGIVVSDAPSWQRSPAVSFDGANFLVVWADSRNTGGRVYEVYGARVSPAGVVLDPQGIRIPGAYDAAPALAFDGANYLVVWTRPGAQPPDAQTYG
ncbi:hypothetical protein FJY71_07680, partial [candidate division WOR-3 bacterium]|nr:hypothetical protein [candidate division WOR-3 bacterium]